MGFFGAMGKILAGKPVYGPNNENTSTDQPVEQNGEAPIVRIERAESHVDGPRLDVYAYVKNVSAQNLFVGKVNLLGTSQTLNLWLRAGEVKELRVYSGAALQNDHFREADVNFRTEGDNWFQARHELMYHRQNDGTMLVVGAHLLLPIKDVPY